jgi:hypothetical protein
MYSASNMLFFSCIAISVLDKMALRSPKFHWPLVFLSINY